MSEPQPEMYTVTLLDGDMENVCTFRSKIQYAALLRCFQVFLILEQIHDPDFKASAMHLFKQYENIMDALRVVDTHLDLSDVVAFFKRYRYSIEFYQDNDDEDDETAADNEIAFLRKKLANAQAELSEELYNHFERSSGSEQKM